MLQIISTLFTVTKAKMDQRGASAVEYGLLVAGIAALVIATVFILGGTINDMFDNTCDTLAGNGTATETNC